MSNFIRESIQETISTTSCKIQEMTPLESVLFRQKIWDKYSDGKPHRALWEHTIGSDFYVREKSAWQWLDEFLQLEETFLFFDKDDDPIFYLFLENQPLTKFLRDFPGYVFYLTNENLDYLISFNDSDYLSAHGTAEPWLRNKAKELSKAGWIDMDGKSYL